MLDARQLDTVDPVDERQALGGVLGRMFGTVAEPTRMGRYVLERRLGAGAMGVVYLAHDPQLDRRVALKIIRSTGAAGSDGDARLEREARALARVRHPNVVAIHDVGRHDNGVFVVMEYVEGSDLEQWLCRSEGPRPWPRVLEVMVAAGHGLRAAHEVGLVHRDFKPANVLIDQQARIQVTDFGLAREPEPMSATVRTAPTATGPLSVLTTAGALVGTPAFMAPELLRGGAADASSDQFAFCVTVWRGLFGGLPFDRPTTTALLEAMEAGPPVCPGTPRVPRWLYQVVRRGLSPDPSQRFGSMADLLER